MAEQHAYGPAKPKPAPKPGPPRPPLPVRVPQKPPAPRNGREYMPDPQWVADTVRRTRAAQGLPPKITDPVTIQTAADLTRDWMITRRRDGVA